MQYSDEDYDYYESGDAAKDQEELDRIHFDALLDTFGRPMLEMILDHIKKHGCITSRTAPRLVENIIYETHFKED